MIATIRQVVIEPYKEYDIVIEVADGEEYQIYRRNYRLGCSQARIWGIDDKGDPRRALGEALEELGRSLQLGHGHRLVHIGKPPNE